MEETATFISGESHKVSKTNALKKTLQKIALLQCPHNNETGEKVGENLSKKSAES